MYYVLREMKTGMDKTPLRLIGAAIAAALAFGAASMSQVPRLAIGIVVGLPSLVLIIIGRRQLGESFSVMPKAKSLVTTGLYSRIQHPLYVFLDLLLLAVIVAFQLPVILWAWVSMEGWAKNSFNWTRAFNSL